MGGYGYVLADAETFAPNEVLFEAGRGTSSRYLERVAVLHGTVLVVAEITEGRDAVKYLIDWPWPEERIKFAYLDSWDWPYTNMDQHDLAQVRLIYEARGQQLTEDASADHHLELAERIDVLAAPHALVVFDDTWCENGRWNGKGRDAVPWLLAGGWQVEAEHCDQWINGSGQNMFYVALRRQS